MELCSLDPYGAADYTDDDIFDFIHEFIKAISE